MTFAQVQNGSATTGTISGGTTTLTLALPAASTAGTLIVACMVTSQAGLPFKITGVTVSGGGTNPNTSPGWEWCCTSVNGSGQGGQQVEIWCYRKNPGNISSATWTIPTNQGARGHLMEFSSTSAYQVMELFPGLNNSVQPGDTSFPVSMGNAVGTGELAVSLFGDNFSSGTSLTWTTPSGWTAGQSTTGAGLVSNHWASYWRTTAAAGAVSVTGTGSTATNQVGWEAAVVVFREAAAVRARVGASTGPGIYTDQASFGFPATKTGSSKEFDVFVGRPMAVTAQVSYQKEGAHLTGPPTGDLAELSAMGAQINWSLKPRRTGVTGFTSVAAEQAAVDQDLTYVKQAGITGFICSLFNEYQLGGRTGPFGDDTFKNGGDPYGTGNTDATAKKNWLTYWSNYQPTLAAHGIPAYPSPAMASPVAASTWLPPAGTVSGVMAHMYADNGINAGKYLDVSPGTDPATGGAAPSLQDVCDGVKNPDGSAATNTPVPLGIGETGRSGGGNNTITWPQVVTWSHTGGNTGHLRDFFAARLTANKQNAPVIWFDGAASPGGPNWIHTPGVNGEDQTGIQAELAAWVDNLAPQAAGTTVTVTTTTLPNAALGVAYSQALQVSGGAAPYTWALLTGSLPTGLSLSAAGVISGTPTVAGTYTFTVKATDAGANIGNSGTLSILVPGMSVTTTSLNPVSIGVPFTQTLTETGGTGPFTWSLTADSVLPAGITLSAAGVLSGTTGDVPGPYQLTVIVTDSLSNTAAAALTLTVTAGAAGGGAPAAPQAGFPQLIVEAGFYAAAPQAPPGTLILDDPVAAVFDTGILADATAWTDITAYVRSGSVSRASTRVQGPLRTWQSGTGSVTLDNSDGRFDPLNLAGPYTAGTTSNVRAMIPLRVRAVFGGVLYNICHFFADSWAEAPVTYDQGWSEVTASGSDGFKVLAGITLPAQLASGTGEPSGYRVTRILNDAGWYTDHRRADAGNSELQATAYGDTALNLLQLAADTEAGQLYIDGAGFVVFRQRQALLEDARSTTVQAIFGDLPGNTARSWMANGADVHTLFGTDPATTRLFFDNTSGYLIGTDPATNPVQDGLAASPVLKYTAYAQFLADVTGVNQVVGGVTFTARTILPVFKWVLYDTENWGNTTTEPQAEVDDPWTYMASFASLAHAHGYKVILTPGRDLGNDATSVRPKLTGENLNTWYLRTGIPAAAAAVADVYEVQDQANTIVDGGPPYTTFTSFYYNARAQAKAVQPAIPVWCGVSTNFGTPAQMYGATQTVPDAEGIWLNMIGDIPDSDAYLILAKGLPPLLAELPYAAVGRATDDTTLANDVQATAAGSPNMQQAKNAASIAKYLFPRSYARTDLLLTSDAETKTWAQWVLWVSQDGENRFDSLTIDPIADPVNLFPQVLGREIGDRILVIRRPQSSGITIVKPCFIAGISHAVDVTAGTWSTTWDLQDAARYAGFLILDDPVLGKVSSKNLLAY